MNINQKLSAIQQELDVPKTKYNEFGKYSYRTVEMILEQLKPLLQENECLLRFNDELIITSESTYVKSTVILSDEQIEDRTLVSIVQAYGFAKEPKEQKGMNASQITSSATSFARKNALTALFLLDDSEGEADDFNTGTEEELQELIIKLNKAQNDLHKLGVNFREDERTKAWIESRTGLKTQDLGEIAKSVKDVAKCRVLLNAYDVLIQGKKLNEKDK